MTRRNVGGIASMALMSLLAAGVAAQAGASQAKESAGAAAAAAKASPELVSALSKEIGATPEQAAGAAGALFGVAKSRLTADEFSKVSKAVPGMDSLLQAAPSMGSTVGTTGALSKVVGSGGSAGGLASAATAFSQLGLSPDMVGKAVPVLTSFVTKSGGADVGKLLGGVLK